WALCASVTATGAPLRPVLGITRPQVRREHDYAVAVPGGPPGICSCIAASGWRPLLRIPVQRVHFRDLTFRLPSVIRSLMDGELRKGIDSFGKEYVHGF